MPGADFEILIKTMCVGGRRKFNVVFTAKFVVLTLALAISLYSCMSVLHGCFVVGTLQIATITYRIDLWRRQRRISRRRLLETAVYGWSWKPVHRICGGFESQVRRPGFRCHALPACLPWLHDSPRLALASERSAMVRGGRVASWPQRSGVLRSPITARRIGVCPTSNARFYTSMRV